MSQRKIKRTGPPPRAGFLADAVLQRSGNVVDIRRIYVGPKDVSPEDLVELLSAVVAVSINNCIKQEEDRKQAKEVLLKKINERIVVREGAVAPADSNQGREPQQSESQQTPKETQE